MRTIRQRVGAIYSGTATTVYLFGYGVYEGDHVPPPEAGGFNLGIPNPRIKLDNGKTVYGCECWWGPEDQIKAKLTGKIIVEVDIDEVRQQAQQASNQSCASADHLEATGHPGDPESAHQRP